MLFVWNVPIVAQNTERALRFDHVWQSTLTHTDTHTHTHTHTHTVEWYSILDIVHVCVYVLS